MPFHASPKKRIRRDLKKTCANKSRKSALKTLLKKVISKEISSEERSSLMQKVQKSLDKAASRGVIHRKNASRRFGRIVKACSSLYGSQS